MLTTMFQNDGEKTLQSHGSIVLTHWGQLHQISADFTKSFVFAPFPTFPCAFSLVPCETPSKKWAKWQFFNQLLMFVRPDRLQLDNMWQHSVSSGPLCVCWGHKKDCELEQRNCMKKWSEWLYTRVCPTPTGGLALMGIFGASLE